MRSGTGATAAGNVTVQRGSAVVLSALVTSTTLGESTLSQLGLGSTATLSLAGTSVMSWGSTIQLLQTPGVLEFGVSVSTPKWRQAEATAGGVTGAAMLLNAQDASGNGSSGAALTVRAGDATGGSGTRNGGALILRSGTGASANGDISIQRGSSVVFSANVSSTFIDNPSTITWRIAGGTTHTTGSAALTAFVRDYLWNDTVAVPRLMQQSTTGAAGALLSIIAQESSAIGGTGGALSIQAGDATGASGTRTGGALTLRSGTGASGPGTLRVVAGTLNVIDYGFTLASTLTVGDALGTATWYRVTSGGLHSFRTGSNQAASLTSSVFELTLPPTFRWHESVVSPTFTQTDNVNASATATAMRISAQWASGTGSTGGALTVQAGDATGASGTRTGGALTLRSGTGATDAGNITLKRGSVNVLEATATSGTTVTVGSAVGPVILSAGGAVDYSVYMITNSTTRHKFSLDRVDFDDLNVGSVGSANLDLMFQGVQFMRMRREVGVSKLSFFGATAVAKPTVTGSRGGNAALASALTALASLGLLTDSSS